MRLILVLFASVFSMLSLAQTEGGVITNSNTNSNTIELKESEEELEVDSTLILEEQEDVQIKTRSKSVVRRKKKAQDYRNEEMAPAEAPVPATVDEVQLDQEAFSKEENNAFQSASYGFQMSKNQSSVQRSQRSPSVQQQTQMDDAVKFFQQNSPNSFEFHYFNYVSGNYDVSRINNLEAAEKLKPNNTDVHVQKAAYNIIKRNNDSAVGYLDKLKSSGRLTQNVLHYSEDILLSVPKNGVLITHGFDDSYGAWYMQHKSKVREDVQLISLDFMQSGHYRALLKEDGFKLPVRKVVDVYYLKEFCELNASKEISISMTTPKEYFKMIQGNLYVTGLVFEYHVATYDNFFRNDELWNASLKKHLVNNATDEKSKQLSSNYLPMLLQLRKVYAQKGEEEKLREVDEAMDKVSVQCKKYDQVQKLKKRY
jgi:hypothetical protein